LPPTRKNLLGRVTCSVGELAAPAEEAELTWAELMERLRQERAEHARLRKKDDDVIRDLRTSEEVMIQLLDLRSQSFNSERRRLIDELNSVCAILLRIYFSHIYLLIYFFDRRLSNATFGKVLCLCLKSNKRKTRRHQ